MALKRQTKPLSLVEPIQDKPVHKNDERIEMFGVYLILFGPIVFFLAVVLDMSFGVNFFITLGIIVGLVIVASLIKWIASRLHSTVLEEEGE